jgi:uncharacterized protein (TIGR03435 family)
METEMKKCLWVCTSAITLVLALQTQRLVAQLPTMGDVDHGGEAKATGSLPQWDVAVIKPHAADDQMMRWQTTPDGISLQNLGLEQMICNAWDMKPYQLSGLTGWMTNTGYDLSAKVSSDDFAAFKKLSQVQRREMLQKLLIERFHLKIHMETKTLPVYDLVPDKGGPKLKESKAIDAPSEEERRANPEKYNKGRMMMGQGRFEGTGVGVRSLASQLSYVLEKPVIDKTELTGLYDITLHYRREETASDSGGDADTPPLLVAVQEQLGLKLVTGKAPVETMVVDAAEKPEAN